jgi:hypothetical protein
MNTYQKSLYKIFEKFRQKPSWPTYPPYHKGDYLEEYFIRYFEENNLNTKKYFIPVAWSSCYINSKDAPQTELQQLLLSLDQDVEYFIVSTHDDAPREILPKNTLAFSAGGNKGNIPIPLIVSPIPTNKVQEKKYLASFVGSLTHPLRQLLLQKHSNNSSFYFSCKQWTPEVSKKNVDDFFDITSQSYFSFAPRGYGKTSYRLYEIMQLGVVPIYLSDQFWLPWKDEIDWKSICIFVNEKNIDNIDIILKKELYSKEYYKKVEIINKIYDQYFTLESTTKKIIEAVNK